MFTSISSAGLLYVYLSGYEEDGMLNIQHIDTYNYIEDELYYKIMEATEFADGEDNTVHVFAAVGVKKM